MVTPKEPKTNILETMRLQSIAFNEAHPVIDTRWIVQEYIPSGSYSWTDDQWIEERVKGTWTFNTEEDANDFYDKHDPDHYCKLRVVKQNLRDYSYKRWGP